MPAQCAEPSVAATRQWPEDVELQRRPLTRAEADEIVAQIRRSPKITGYSRREWMGRRDTFVLVRPHTNEFLGALLVHHLFGNWCEIAVVFVLDDHRGNGYGRHLLRATLRTLRSSGKRQLLFFSDGPMGKLAKEFGFETFADEDDFIQGRAGRWLFLKVAYKAQWLCSAYRVRELRRKRKALGVGFDFQVAMLTP